MNSGITKEVEFEDRFEFQGVSGSVYTCYKGCYGMSGYMRMVLDGMIEKFKGKAEFVIEEGYEKD